MTAYISLINFTDSGVRDLGPMAERVRAMQNRGEQEGVRLLAWYATMGEYDAVAIAEATDDETMMQALLRVGGEGAIRTSTLRAFPLEDFEQMVRARSS
jgi:uncharacterized protein with GYD domain